MKLLAQRPRTHEDLIRQYREWDTAGRSEPVRPTLIVGMLYSKYRLRYGSLPITLVPDDVRNIEQFLRMYLKDDPSLAPYVIDVLFNLKGFNGISTQALLNQNILNGWGIIERAVKLRKKPKSGEQSEFVSDGPGTLYV
jgi:hypothetical protein